MILLHLFSGLWLFFYCSHVSVVQVLTLYLCVVFPNKINEIYIAKTKKKIIAVLVTNDQSKAF